jgi:hypothetical protein
MAGSRKLSRHHTYDGSQHGADSVSAVAACSDDESGGGEEATQEAAAAAAHPQFAAAAAKGPASHMDDEVCSPA